MPPAKRKKLSPHTSTSTSWAIKPLLPQSSASKVSAIWELVELILIKLSYRDLLHCTQVSRDWRTLMSRSVRLQRLLYKLPTQISSSEPNAHFEAASPTATAALIPAGPKQGHAVLQISQQHLNTFLDKVTSQHLTTRRANQALETYLTAMYDVRRAFRGIRISHGWPRALAETYCDMCEGFHTRVEHKTLHRLLRFLGDVDICCKGSGGQVLLEVRIVREYRVPRRCYEDYFDMLWEYARSLKRAVEIAETSDLQGDQVASPRISDILLLISIPDPPLSPGEVDVEPHYIHLRNENGIRLGEFLPGLVRGNRLGVEEVRSRVRTMRPEMWDWNGDLPVGTGEQLDAVIRFPTRGDYVEYVNGWDEIVRRVEEVVDGIGEFMGEVCWLGWG